MKFVCASLLALAGAASAVSGQVFQEIGRVDLRGVFATADPQGAGQAISAVAWNGTDLYANGWRTTSTGPVGIVRVSSALSSPVIGSTFGQLNSVVASRGYTGLDIRNDVGSDGSGNNGSLGASFDSGSGSADSLATYNLDAVNTRRWRVGDAAAANDSTRRGMSGVGVDPGFAGNLADGGGIGWTTQGAGRRVLNNTGTGVYDFNFSSGMLLTSPGGASAYNNNWRDMDFNDLTGDVWLRTENRVVLAPRTAANATGTRVLLPVAPGVGVANNAGQNLAYLLGVAGGDFVVYNDRDNTANGQSFFDVIKLMTPAGDNRNIEWRNQAGTAPFVPAQTGAGWYDFSWDRASGTLAVSDFSGGFVYIFSVVPAPSSAVLLGLGGLVAARRRR